MFHDVFHTEKREFLCTVFQNLCVNRFKCKQFFRTVVISGTISDSINCLREIRLSFHWQAPPFTVTDNGVLTCRGNDGNIVLKDGTIYFIVGGVEYKLGITNGKPDWINSAGADSTEIWYQKRESDTNVSFS